MRAKIPPVLFPGVFVGSALVTLSLTTYVLSYNFVVDSSVAKPIVQNSLLQTHDFSHPFVFERVYFIDIS